MDNQTITCSKCKSNFLVIKEEKDFLAKRNLPLPTNCPGCRQERRLLLRGSKRALFKTKCQKCQKEIVTSFDPQKTTSPIYCREDYEKYFVENDPIIKDPLPE